jgi:hypothetical protein
MRSKSILKKSIICGFAYLAFLLLFIFVVYILDFFIGAFFVGLPCGAIIAIVTCCDTLKRTVIARLIGLLSAVVSQLVFEILGVPYQILLYVYRNDSFVREMGHLTINETLGYGWGRVFFWSGLVISFILTILGIFIIDKIKSLQE